MIFADPSELLHINDASLVSLKKLEELSGADFMILPNGVIFPHSKIIIPKEVSDFNNVVGQSILVQRKSGGDLINSIPDLRDIRQRMFATGARYIVLLIDGNFERKDNLVVVNGRDTGWHYNSLLGALHAWQRDDGLVFHSGGDTVAALKFMQSNIFNYEVKQAIGRNRMPVRYPLEPEKEASILFLMGLPGIGYDRAVDVLEACEWRTLDALCLLSMHPDLFKKIKQALHLTGIGDKTNAEIRLFLNLKPDEKGIGPYSD